MALHRRAAALLLLVASVQALDTTGLPACGRSCVNNGLSLHTSCSSSNTACICADSSLGYDIGYCLGSNCDTDDMNTSLNWLVDLCSGSSGGSATTGALYFPTSTGGTSYSTYTSTYSSYKRKKGLSSGAKAGIGIGVVLALALIGGGILLAFTLARRKRNPVTDASREPEALPPTGAPPPNQPPPPAGFAVVPPIAEKTGFQQPHVTEYYQHQPPPPQQQMGEIQPQHGVILPGQVPEKAAMMPTGQPNQPHPVSPVQSYTTPISPPQTVPSPAPTAVSAYTTSPSPPPVYPQQPQPQPYPVLPPTVYEMPAEYAATQQPNAPMQPPMGPAGAPQIYEAPSGQPQEPR